MDGGVAEVAHDVVEAVVALHHVARPADQVGRLLDVAEGLEPVLADLHRQQRAELHLPLADDVGRAPEESDSLLPRPPAPGGKRRAGGRDRVLDVLAGALRERAHDRAVDRRPLLERAVAVAPRPADVVLVRLAQHRADLLDAGVELGVKLLVVVAQRGVGDLEARLGLGRHRALGVAGMEVGLWEGQSRPRGAGRRARACRADARSGSGYARRHAGRKRGWDCSTGRRP